MAKRKIYLSKSQLSEFLTVSESISEDEMLYYYTLSEEDIQLALSHRGDDNRLGFAMTLCCIRHKGWPYSVLEAVPEKVKLEDGQKLNLEGHGKYTANSGDTSHFEKNEDGKGTIFINDKSFDRACKEQDQEHSQQIKRRGPRL